MSGPSPRESLRLSYALVLAFALVLFLSMFDLAYAATGPQMDPSCSLMATYGFSMGLMYCIQSSIGGAVAIYVAAMQQNLLFYEGMAMMVAIALFGLKLMNSGVRRPGRETIKLAVRIITGVLLFSQAGLIYTVAAGSTSGGGTLGIANQLIGWVTGGSGDTALFANLIAANCGTPPAPPPNFQGYQVWQAFDCMFSVMFGATASGGSGSGGGALSYAFTTSMVVIAGASMLSGTMGVIIFMLALNTFFSALFMLMRALYMVLLAYLCIGFLTVFTPLMAPLLFFDSKYINEKVKNWGRIILNAMLQPMFVIGFLALAITVEDQFIEGKFSGCVPPTYPTSSGTEPAQGWGQDGSGMCSFTQLFYNNQTRSAAASGFSEYLENNYTFWNWLLNSSPQAQSVDASLVDTQGASYLNQKRMGSNLAYQMQAPANNMVLSGTHLKDYVPLRQLMVTLLAFVFTTSIMLKLMEIIPDMARSLTVGVGLNLYRGVSVPFEDTVNGALGGMGDAMQKAAAGTGLLSGNLRSLTKFGDVVKAGVKGAGSGALEGADATMVSKR